MNSTTMVTTGRNERRTLWPVVLLGIVLFLSPWTTAGKEKKAAAVIAGTVVQDNGGSLPGARVVVISESEPKDKQEAMTDRRGEFALRVHGGKRYRVTASAKGFEAQEKLVETFEGEKVVKNFLLSVKRGNH